jgi:hypothetical protein
VKTIDPNKLARLTDPSLDVVSLIDLLRQLGVWERGKYDHLESAIAAHLHHQLPMVRGQAIGTLLGAWGRSRYFDTAAQMLLEDRDEDSSARTGAVLALKAYANKNPGERERVIRILVKALKQDPDEVLQMSAYQAILDLLLPDNDFEAPYEFDRDRDVDWEILKPFE